jgi:hypothetical protein
MISEELAGIEKDIPYMSVFSVKGMYKNLGQLTTEY